MRDATTLQNSQCSVNLATSTVTRTGTKLVVTYVVSGYQPGKGFEPLAAPVNQMLTEQVTRLKRFVETGKP